MRSGLPTAPFDLSIDVRTNTIEVMTDSRAAFESFAAERNLAVTDRMRVVLVPELIKPAANIYGGLSVTGCTSGFTVKVYGGATIYGITTAGHCSNTQSYQSVSLPLYREYYRRNGDAQWHTTPGFSERNWIKDGLWDSYTPYYRIITAKTYWSDQPIGGTVCKYGKMTYYDCGTITAKNIAPGYVPDAQPVFIRAHNANNVNMVDGGDSGGPVFLGGSAYGTISGAINSIDLVYGEVGYMEDGLEAAVITYDP